MHCRHIEHASAVLTVDLDAISANWRMLKERVGKAECAAVVKADAYGLGAKRIAQHWLPLGAVTSLLPTSMKEFVFVPTCHAVQPCMCFMASLPAPRPNALRTT